VSLIGVDLGTSGTRVLAIDVSGEELASAARSRPLSRPSPGLVELDAERVFGEVVDCLAEVVAHPAVAADPVDAISFSVLGEAVVPVGPDGSALGPAPVSMDGRGAALADAVGRAIEPERIQRITGQPLHPMFSVYKVGSRRGFPPDARPHCLGDFVAMRLGGTPALDPTMAARTGAFDVDAMRWSDEIAEASGVPVDVWPEVVPAGTAVGGLSRDVAARCGLAAGTPLVVGSHDQASSFWGAGGCAGRTSVCAFGSSDCLTVGTDGRPGTLAGTGLATYPVAGSLWLTLAGTAAGGWALDWWAGIAGATDDDERAVLLSQPSADPPPLLVLPYLAGSGTVDNDPLGRGAVLGLTLETTRDQLTRALLESAGFELAKIVDVLADRGLATGEIVAVGAGAAATRSVEIRAAAAGTSISCVPGPASARGAAFQAGVGVGAYPSLRDLPAPPRAPACVPDPAHEPWYAAQRRRYRELASALIPFSHGLAVGSPTDHTRRTTTT
jgi:sugar (pentulose or hexulose) kinase